MTAPTGAEAEPGFWRRIELHPSTLEITAGIEDDAHRFLIRLGLHDNVVSAVEVKGERIPYTTCAAAGAFFETALIGMKLQAVRELDAHLHCTHVIDLAVLAAGHADDAKPTRFDMRVTDPMDGKKRATLYENGRQMLQWHIDGTQIHAAGIFDGLDLRKFSEWKKRLSPQQLEQAAILRRAAMVSGARALPKNDVTRPADRGAGRLGACFTYQMPWVMQAERVTPDWRKEFSGSDGPLQDWHA